MTTLLEKALAANASRSSGRLPDVKTLVEQLDVVLAYCQGIIDYRQAGVALPSKHGSTTKNIHQRMGKILLQAVRQDLLIKREHNQ